ncbi:hypothetical protein B0H13DRAFT_1919839 [Mycena leptocephala]|nr:hypothetical protein B0H13DRAFT_1919839 [Mycena leptocephala]
MSSYSQNHVSRIKGMFPLRSCLKLYSQMSCYVPSLVSSLIAYAAALPIRELHQVRNYTACTFDPPPAFLVRILSGLSPKVHWFEHISSTFCCAALVDNGNQARRVETGTGTHAYGVQDTVAAAWEGSGILRRQASLADDLQHCFFLPSADALRSGFGLGASV